MKGIFTNPELSLFANVQLIFEIQVTFRDFFYQKCDFFRFLCIIYSILTYF